MDKMNRGGKGFTPGSRYKSHQGKQRHTKSYHGNRGRGQGRFNRQSDRDQTYSGHQSYSGQSPSCSSTNEEENSELEIPGFIYDKEKKRYFKIAPNHSQNNYTKDAIVKRKAESQRLKDVDQLLKKPALSKKRSCNSNIVSVLRDRTLSCIGQNQMELKLTRTTFSNLKPVGSQYLFDSQHLGINENLEHMHFMKVSENHMSILGLWSLKETWIQRLQLVDIVEGERTKHDRTLSVKATCQNQNRNVIILSLNKVTDMCWASSGNNEKHVLYTTICHTGAQHSLAKIRSLEDDANSPCHDFNIGRKATWACAWNNHRQQFSVGSEKCALIVNVDRRTMLDYNTHNSDPLCQLFSNQTGNSFITGTRNGEILIFDLRSGSAYPVANLRHKSSVCGLNLLHNDQHLLAADFTGRVCLWDVRMKRTVLEYEGNVNQYTKIPVHVDESESIVYTVGEDGYTRFWCIKQGTLLHTIPPPCPVSRETIPTVQFSMRWGNKSGNAGLIMGLENKLHFYGKLNIGT